MKRVRFLIHRIHVGWFDVHFQTGTAVVGISASDAWGNDAPRLWLEQLTALLAGRQSAAYVLFDEEPGVYVLSLELGEAPRFTLGYSELDSDEALRYLPAPAGALSYREAAVRLPITEVYIRTSLDLPFFVRSVYEAFLPYTEKLAQDKYEGNWMPFPREAWTAFAEEVRRRGWDEAI